ncbi:hypothetical protein CRENBAI_001090 [Crenichthys baileyi]|uniref:Uncharacterized protein n=1 Tax=Crenichthys baileyi TaxID=28760 RepID=A0AAV9QSS6_9TELE
MEHTPTDELHLRKLMKTHPHSASSTHSPTPRTHALHHTTRRDGKTLAQRNATPASAHKRIRAETTQHHTHNTPPPPHPPDTTAHPTIQPRPAAPDRPSMREKHVPAGESGWVNRPRPSTTRQPPQGGGQSHRRKHRRKATTARQRLGTPPTPTPEAYPGAPSRLAIPCTKVKLHPNHHHTQPGQEPSARTRRPHPVMNHCSQ